MTNHNNIWYESGRAARYGGEPGTSESDADSRIRSIIIQIIQILHKSTMPHLQLFCAEDLGLVCLRAKKDNGDRKWIELEKTNELSQLMKLVRRSLVRLEMCGIEWTGTLPGTAAVGYWASVSSMEGHRALACLNRPLFIMLFFDDDKKNPDFLVL